MIPEKREKIVKRIEDYGFSRMVAGVHFRSDVYAGQVAGAAITTSLFRNEDFRNAFDKARAEVRKSLGY
jgi:acid phosphatase (class A)